MSTYNPKRFMVYVIKLDPAVLAHRKFRDDNPNYQSGKDCYYVAVVSQRSSEERELISLEIRV